MILFILNRLIRNIYDKYCYNKYYLPIRPPGTANCSSFCSANKDTMRENIGRQVRLPSVSLDTNPGRTSISMPTYDKTDIYDTRFGKINLVQNYSHTFNTPLSMLPPATPPFKSSTSQPGLFTSKDRITINRGSDVKSLIGTGIFLVMYSHRTSMLYFSCAEIGIIGAPSATVPDFELCKQNYINRLYYINSFILAMERGYVLTRVIIKSRIRSRPSSHICLVYISLKD